MIEVIVALIPPVLLFLVGTETFGIYKFTKNLAWLLSSASIFMLAVANIFNSFYFLSHSKFFLLPCFLFILLAAIVEWLSLSKIYKSVLSPPPTIAAALMKREIAAFGELSHFTNLYLKEVTNDAGEKLVKTSLESFLKKDEFFKRAKFVDGTLDLEKTVRGLETAGPESLKQVYASFYRLHFLLFKLHASVTSPERASEVFSDSFSELVKKYGEGVYDYGLPLLLSIFIFMPLLHRCREKTLNIIETTVAGDSSLSGVRVNLQKKALDLEKLYGITQKRSRTTSGYTNIFARLMRACYPLIRRDLGKDTERILSNNFLKLIKKHPALHRLGIAEIVPSHLTIRGPPAVSAGRSYLIKCEEASEVYHLMAQLSEYGWSCLCVTPVYPDEVAGRYGLNGKNIIWLSKTADKQAVNPSSMDILRDKIIDFMNRQKVSAILLDGLEFLILTNGLENTLKFIRDISEVVPLHSAVFLVPINPAAVDQKDLAILERLMSELKLERRAPRKKK